MIFSIWPLTYDLDLQSQPSQGQGRPPYSQKSRMDATKYIINHGQLLIESVRHSYSCPMKPSWSAGLNVWEEPKNYGKPISYT